MRYSTLRNTYTIGNITGNSETGGIVGSANGSTVSYNSYWEKGLCGQSKSALGVIKTLSDLGKQKTYTGYDFTNVWGIDEGQSTAYLNGMKIPNEVANALDGLKNLAGTGTEKEPYQIWTVKQLQEIECNKQNYYKIMTDLDLERNKLATNRNTKQSI